MRKAETVECRDTSERPRRCADVHPRTNVRNLCKVGKPGSGPCAIAPTDRAAADRMTLQPRRGPSARRRFLTGPMDGHTFICFICRPSPADGACVRRFSTSSAHRTGWSVRTEDGPVLTRTEKQQKIWLRKDFIFGWFGRYLDSIRKPSGSRRISCVCVCVDLGKHEQFCRSFCRSGLRQAGRRRV